MTDKGCLRRSLVAGVTPGIRLVLAANAFFQLLILVTGNIVRISKSGLGCPTWPGCSEESLVTAPGAGVHGYIEFGNRLIAIAVGVVSIVALVIVWRLRKTHRSIFYLTFISVLGVPAQAVIGGISVLTKLNPYVVGLHTLLSILLISGTCFALFATYARKGCDSYSGFYRCISVFTVVVACFVIILGILTTGNLKHSGDAAAPRNSLVLAPMIHGIAAFILLILVIVVFAISIRRRFGITRTVGCLLCLLVAQITIGLLQIHTDLPGYLVTVHVVLAALLVSALTLFVKIYSANCRAPGQKIT